VAFHGRASQSDSPCGDKDIPTRKRDEKLLVRGEKAPPQSAESLYFDVSFKKLNPDLSSHTLRTVWQSTTEEVRK
jgi:hypothetical protein